MVVCITVNMLRIYTSFELDHHRFALTLYRTSQFVLALLLAFRLVSIKYHGLVLLPLVNGAPHTADAALLCLQEADCMT